MKKPSQRRKKKSTRKKRPASPAPQAVPNSEGAPVPERKDPLKRISPAVPKKEPDRKKEEKGSVFRYVGVAVQFLKEARFELKKVKWPTRKELLASTAVVIVLVLVVAFFLGLIDFGLIKIIKNIVG
jgi:preprotein translocase subunit SecE